MTCIVGIEADGLVYMGGDSNYSDGHTQGLLAADTPKVWRSGDYLLGVSGSARVANVLRFLVFPPAPTRGVLRHMVTKVVPALRKTLRKTGRLLQEQRSGGSQDYAISGGDASDGTLLVGVRGKLFAIHGDFQVCHPRTQYDAIGSGVDVALGALHVTKGMPPRTRVRRALEASEAHACGVRRPWRILSA